MKMLCRRTSGKRRILTTILLSALLISAIVGTGLVQNGAKIFFVQGEVFSGSSTIIDGDPEANVTILSPIDKVYSVDNVSLAFTIETDVELGGKNWSGTLFDPLLMYGCFLDYDIADFVANPAWLDLDNLDPLKPGFIAGNVEVVLSRYGNGYVGNATLTGLSQGSHNVTVWVKAGLSYISFIKYAWSVFSTVSFNVDFIPLNISFLSPQAKAYGSSIVPLNLAVNEATSILKYSLDGQDNVTLMGNTTLTDLSNGDHNITVYGVDSFGNPGTFEPVRFSVEPFPTTLVAIAIVALAAIVSFGLVAYFLRRNKKRSET